MDLPTWVVASLHWSSLVFCARRSLSTRLCWSMSWLQSIARFSIQCLRFANMYRTIYHSWYTVVNQLWSTQCCFLSIILDGCGDWPKLLLGGRSVPHDSCTDMHTYSSSFIRVHVVCSVVVSPLTALTSIIILSFNWITFILTTRICTPVLCMVTGSLASQTHFCKWV